MTKPQEAIEKHGGGGCFKYKKKYNTVYYGYYPPGFTRRSSGFIGLQGIHYLLTGSGRELSGWGRGPPQTAMPPCNIVDVMT